MLDVSDVLRGLLGFTAVVLALGALAAVAVRVRARGVVGEVIEREVLGLGRRAPAVTLLLLGAAAAAAGREVVPLEVGLAALASAACFLLVRPGRGDRVMGSAGLRRGWYVRRLTELEEWRLTGEHLRFRLRGRWEAVPLAAARQAEIGERLRAAIPERESSFRD